jgi:hypothetical protein
MRAIERGAWVDLYPDKGRVGVGPGQVSEYRYYIAPRSIARINIKLPYAAVFIFIRIGIDPPMYFVLIPITTPVARKNYCCITQRAF